MVHIKQECTFCGKEIEPGTGVMYVTRTGVSNHFCSTKCKKNLLGLKRVPRRVPWTKAYAEENK